jgi:rhamnopyranosyl-N-acetylglucosaminyl-diphospho-decaprenol beta-1,3/1,4-galactofuranosyltransferase
MPDGGVDERIGRHRTVVVIVTFNSAATLRDVLGDLQAQTRKPDDVVIVDNASTDSTAEVVRTAYPAATYIRLPENMGSAGGYVAGIRMALNTADFVLTLDDDVALGPKSIEMLLAGIRRLNANRRIGAVRSVGRRHFTDEPTLIEIVPWRGTLFDAAAIREVGLPDAAYFLYGEDLEYSLRLRKHGYSFYWIPQSICVEVRQEKTQREFLGKHVEIYSEAFRLYYAFRNEVSIYLTYRAFGSLLKTFVYAAKVLAYIGLIQRVSIRNRCYAILRGVIDGIAHRHGKNERYLPSRTLSSQDLMAT